MGVRRHRGRTGFLKLDALDPIELAELIEVGEEPVLELSSKAVETGRLSLTEQFKKAQRPLGHLERLAAISKAFEAASRQA